MLFDKFNLDFLRKMFIFGIGGLALLSYSSVGLTSSSDTFTGKECLEAEFDLDVSHPAWPMGLTKRKLGVKKRQCVVTITHKKLKVWKRKWVIDVCREPVHIKSGSGAVEVLKRSGHCDKGVQTDYCSELKEISNILQDDGLIFAKGEKEEIRSPHGQIYCTHLLVHEYLNNGRVLSRHSFDEAIFPGRREDSASSQKKDKKERSMNKKAKEKEEAKDSSGSSGSF